jgi:hypothetical protein
MLGKTVSNPPQYAVMRDPAAAAVDTVVVRSRTFDQRPRCRCPLSVYEPVGPRHGRPAADRIMRLRRDDLGGSSTAAALRGRIPPKPLAQRDDILTELVLPQSFTASWGIGQET